MLPLISSHRPYRTADQEKVNAAAWKALVIGEPLERFTVALHCGIEDDLQRWEFSGATLATAKAMAGEFIEKQLRLHGDAFRIPGIAVRRMT